MPELDDIDAFFGPSDPAPTANFSRRRGGNRVGGNKLVSPPAPVTAAPTAEVKRGRGRPPLPDHLKKPKPARMTGEELQAFRVANLAKARAARAAVRPVEGVAAAETVPAPLTIVHAAPVPRGKRGIRKPLDPATRIKVGKEPPRGAHVVRACQLLFSADETMTIQEARELAEMMVEFPNGDRDDILGRWGIASGYFVTA